MYATKLYNFEFNYGNVIILLYNMHIKGEKPNTHRIYFTEYEFEMILEKIELVNNETKFINKLHNIYLAV